MTRKSGSKGQRLDEVEKEIEDLKKFKEETNNKLNNFNERFILEDLMKERFSGSGKPMYTYEDIARRNRVSKSNVLAIAAANNLLRRKNKDMV